MMPEFNSDRIEAPMTIEQFGEKFWPEDNMIWKDGFHRQIDDFRRIRNMFNIEAKVISTHTSKSIKLPVVKFVKKGEFTIVVRNNFQNVIMSVESVRELDFLPINYPQEVHHVYCEGFMKEWVFEGYEDNKKSFTVELNCIGELYSILGAVETNLLRRESERKKTTYLLEMVTEEELPPEDLELLLVHSNQTARTIGRATLIGKKEEQ